MNLKKLTPKQLQFISTYGNAGKLRTPIASLAIGKAISNRLTLPQGVDDLETAYKSHVEPELHSRLSALNELAVLDIDAILADAKKCIYAQHYATSPCDGIHCTSEQTALAAFLGVNRALDVDTLANINRSPVELSLIHNGMLDILRELKYV